MNTSSNLPLDQDPPERDVLPGEYVLGVLHAAERRRVERLIDTDPAFAADVAAWENRLQPLADEIAPVMPPDYLWARISSMLGLGPAPRAAVAPEPQRDSLWQSLGLWRLLTAGGFATAAVCLFALLNAARVPQLSPATPPVATAPDTPPPPAAPVEMASTLTQDDGQPGYVATLDAARGRITVTPLQPAAEDDGRVPELWLIPPDGVARSLGVFDETAPQSADIPREFLALLSAEAILAVTLEPPGGAPGGVATGPVVAKGGLRLLAMAP
ncbi:MAG TPA: anti-sigma factor [Pseudoxanthomonas sp.]|nr:anti-sigma factor [Pseudoxanthomonas sp.]